MISKRLLKVAEKVIRNKVVFDVGSDHAQLPCFLLKDGIVEKAYAGDINEGPLNAAKKTIKKLHLEGKVIPVLSDGLKEAPDDARQVVISGMGYYTIEHILNNADLNKYDNFIIQSNTDVNYLRQYISDHNFTIYDEEIVYDGFYYQIVCFNTEFHEQYSELEIKYGPVLLTKNTDTFKDYLKWNLLKQKQIYDKTNNLEVLGTIKELENLI